MKLTGLLDCNNFFVSCERLFRPDIQSRPVVVLSGNDGCIVARSNEVKDLGVPMGVPYFQVRDELTSAGATTFSSNFTLYRDISRRVLTTLSELVETVEAYSIDEAFFALTAVDDTDVEAQLREIKQTIEQRVGVPVSVGAATTKTIAKYASEKEKRGRGVCVLRGAGWQHETASLPVEQVWGVGRKLAERLHAQQLYTVADLLAADRGRVHTLFGVVGARLYDELSEQIVWPVGKGAGDTQKSIMSSRSFRHTTTRKSVVLEAVNYHVHQVAAELRSFGLSCQQLQVVARPSRHGDWVLRGGRAECVLPAPTSDTRVLVRYAEVLLDECYELDVPYKKVGVVLSGLTDATVTQPDLFGVITEAPAAEPVMQVFDALNQKFGHDVVTVGRQREAGAWASARERLSPRYTTNWTEIASVTA